MFARIRDTTIYFDIDGAGLVPDGPRMRERPVAFVIHGGPGSDHSGFKPGYAPLTRAMQLVYFDHRGQGRSARDGDPARWTLGLGPIVSIGTSYGGMVGMAHAARYPDSVSHLILVVTAAHGGFIRRAREILAERGTQEQQAITAALWDGGFRSEEDVRRFHTVMGPLYSRRFDIQKAGPALARLPYAPEPLNRAFGPDGFLRRFDLRPELARITAPTLIIAGRHDWICPPEFSEEIHRLIPGSRLEIFEESSHSIRADEPERLMAAILDFVGAPVSD